MDVDVPTRLEADHVKNHTFRKVIWAFLQPLFYSLRPTYVMPLVPNKWEILNAICQVSFNICILRFWGTSSMM